MPKSSDSRNAVGIVVMVGWVLFAVFYPGCWAPSAIIVRSLE